VLVGVGRTRITPAVGMPLSGFAGRGAALHVHDDLEATAVAFAGAGNGGESVDAAEVGLVLVACDLLSLDEHEIANIRRAVEAVAGVPASRIWVSSSHTHYGPVTDRSGTSLTVETPVPQSVVDYLDYLRWAIAGAVAEAVAGMRPATVRFGTGSTAIGVNRRQRLTDGRTVIGQNPDGPCDHRVAVLRVDAVDGRPLAAVLNYACHGVSLGGTCREVSADFIGEARRIVEAETGATCLYIQGAAGNINPVLMGDTWSNPKRLGLQLASEALNTFWSPSDAVEHDGGRRVVTTAGREFRLPGLVESQSVEEAQARLEECEAEVRRLESRGDRAGAYWARVVRDRFRRELRVLSGEEERPEVRAEISAAGLGGSIGLVSAPGEVFTEIGTSIIERSPFELTMYCGYTNGSIHYIPTRAAYSEGGYEVERACIVAPEAGERIEKESVALLGEECDVAR
jgi:neutral ceramidase